MIARGTSETSVEKVVITDFNQKLAAAAAAFKANHTGVSTWWYDSNTAFTTILDNPTQYGFVDATSYGSTGDFWGNNYHPSSKAHDIFGQQIGNLLFSSSTNSTTSASASGSLSGTATATLVGSSALSRSVSGSGILSALNSSLTSPSTSSSSPTNAAMSLEAGMDGRTMVGLVVSAVSVLAGGWLA
jgi:phospholipase/lecithinase/hemolysin